MTQVNKHIGSSLEDLLQADGTADDARSVAIKRTVALQIQHEMTSQKISKAEMARRMKTSATQLARLLDPDNDRVQLDTLFKAANAVGRSLSVQLS